MNFSFDPSNNSSAFEYRIDPVRIKNRALTNMGLVEGFCSEAKACGLVSLILEKKPQVVVEIGVWGGKSLVPMATAVASYGGLVYGVDPWSNEESLVGMTDENNKFFWGNVDHESVLYALMFQLDELGLSPFVELIRATSENAPPIYGIDFLHIDGNHSDETSYADVTKWVPLVKEGGTIVFDDIGWYEDGVSTNARAVAWLDAYCEKIFEIQDTSVWGVWRR